LQRSTKFKRANIGDVGQPQQVWLGGRELAVDEVVVHGWAGFAVEAAFFGEH
jgi:hypothetical protein